MLCQIFSMDKKPEIVRSVDEPLLGMFGPLL